MKPGRPETPQLVEHFFRHESANLIAVLTRAFGLGYLDLVEDTVQDALLTAMESWSRQGVPANPSGWIYRVARNRILDALRRDKIHQQAVSKDSPDPTIETRIERWLDTHRLPDSLLRMIFVCCHPALDRRSQIALTLKILGGFSLAEIARGLLISPEAAKKRVQRAKKTLARQEIEIDLPPADALQSRLAAVHDVLYLMFNEGYSTSQGHEPLRDDICEEAARLCHLLCEHETLSTPETRALLALMLAHASRLDARVDDRGVVVLLEDQDRSKWNRTLIHMAELWLGRSKTVTPSRFHLEAAIALTHCHAASVAETDWDLIVRYYDRLLTIHPSPLYVLNRAVARGETGQLDQALVDLETIRDHPELRGYALLDCALGRLHELRGNIPAAVAAFSRAYTVATAPHERALLDKRLASLNGG